MPDHVDLWDRWLAELASRPQWTFSPYGDAVRTGDEPLMVSEFGNWGLPRLPDQLPWWFNISFGERGVTRPAGVLERFHAYGFDRIFGSFSEMAEETQRHQFVSLKHEIESIRSYEALQGYVITGVTDVHWEVNGLLDMWRNEKVYVNDLSKIQTSDLIACRLTAYSFYEKDHVEVPAFISHFSDVDLSGASLRWRTTSGESGQYALPADLRPGSVNELPPIRIVLPATDRPSSERLELELRHRNGNRLAENYYTLPVLPRRSSVAGIRVAARGDESSQLSSQLQANGFEIAESVSPGDVLIADRYDNATETHLQNGGRVILLTGDEAALPSHWPLRVVSRIGTELDGRWFSNFNWIRPDREPFSSVAFTPILNFESAAVAPRHVIQGFAPAQFDDVLSGITYGWLNNNCALTAQVHVGSGQMLLTTYRFHRYGADPFTTELLNSFLSYVAGVEMLPRLKLRTEISADSRELVNTSIPQLDK